MQGYIQAQYHVLHEDLRSSVESHFFGLVNGDFAKELCEQIETASEKTIKLAKAELHELEASYPELVTAIQVRQAAAITLNHQRETIAQVEAHGTLSDAEAERLNKKVNRGLKRVLQYDHHVGHVFTARQMLTELPYYDQLFSGPGEPGSEEVYAPHTQYVRTSNAHHNLISGISLTDCLCFQWNVPDTAETPKTHLRTVSTADIHIEEDRIKDDARGSRGSDGSRNLGAGVTAFIVLRGQLRLSVFHNGAHLRDRMIDTSAMVGLVEMLQSVDGAGTEGGWRITTKAMVTTWQLTSDEISGLCEEKQSCKELLWRLAGVFTVFAGMGHAYTLTVDSIEVARKFRGKRWGYLSDILLDRGRAKHVPMTDECLEIQDEEEEARNHGDLLVELLLTTIPLLFPPDRSGPPSCTSMNALLNLKRRPTAEP